MPRWLHLMIVRAAPTCTLWNHYDLNEDALRFALWRRWAISGRELMQYR